MGQERVSDGPDDEAQQWERDEREREDEQVDAPVAEALFRLLGREARAVEEEQQPDGDVRRPFDGRDGTAACRQQARQGDHSEQGEDVSVEVLGDEAHGS